MKIFCESLSKCIKWIETIWWRRLRKILFPSKTFWRRLIIHQGRMSWILLPIIRLLNESRVLYKKIIIRRTPRGLYWRSKSRSKLMNLWVRTETTPTIILWVLLWKLMQNLWIDWKNWNWNSNSIKFNNLRECLNWFQKTISWNKLL